MFMQPTGETINQRRSVSRNQFTRLNGHAPRGNLNNQLANNVKAVKITPIGACPVEKYSVAW